jgi:eukaryotic-like serine/threonine-protein kinase
MHRDLKPANIKITPDSTVKVLDFGLAKVLERAPAGDTDVTVSPTITSPTMIGRGVIMGTAAYMSPEQAKGRTADKRSDVWAFGCVLYEMLTGTRAFPGDDISETLAAVIKSEPDWHALPPGTPAAIRRLLRRCLMKDPKERLPDAAVARIEIDEAKNQPEGDGPRPNVISRPWVRWAWPAAAVLFALIAAVAISRQFRPVATAPEVRFEIATPPTNDPLSLAISPDGQKIVFVANAEKLVT